MPACVCDLNRVDIIAIIEESIPFYIFLFVSIGSGRGIGQRLDFDATKEVHVPLSNGWWHY